MRKIKYELSSNVQTYAIFSGEEMMRMISREIIDITAMCVRKAHWRNVEYSDATRRAVGCK